MPGGREFFSSCPSGRLFFRRALPGCPGLRTRLAEEMMQTRGRDEFASDNTAGICPEALAAIEEANNGSVPAYGDDQLTAQLCDKVRDIFETNCDLYIVFNGT